MHIPALQNWQRTKPIRPFWPFVAPQNACEPYLEEMTKFNACATYRDCQGQRQCNGYELQCCINMLRGLHSFGFPGLITHTAPDTRPPTVAAPSELPDNPPADREPPARPNPATDLPAPSNPPPTDSRATTTHHETADYAAPDHDRRHWNNNTSWDDTTYTHRDRRSSYREGYSRDHHREGLLVPALRHTIPPDLAGKRYITAEYLAI